ncbi:MAG TPA: glycogen debranching N-terminal domain-containing protein [Candidatus Limnocylindria bacterium]|nr:glycogen debranching N-terminal domain-containing protein [Candidatus Limnocylindria bacterium]
MSVSLKEDALVLITEDDGGLVLGSASPYGLYYHDTQFLSGYALRVNGSMPILLSANTEQNYVATFQLMHSEGAFKGSARHDADALSIRRTRFLADGLRERIGVLNANPRPVRVALELEFEASFRDMFAVRGYRDVAATPHETKRGAREGGIVFERVGRDAVRRTTDITMRPAPDRIEGNVFHITRDLPPQGLLTIELAVIPREDGAGAAPSPDRFDDAIDALNARYRRFLRGCTRYTTTSETLDEGLITRSALDLRALMEFHEGGPFPTAGIPWYAVPFGRDGLIAAYQTLGWNPDVARGTLRLLAKYQGQKVDDFSEEEPGKIFHELRRGELARLGEIPHRPYYGSVDATPLFAMVFAEAVKWTADRALWRELLPAAERALTWCDTYGDVDRDGYVEYGTRSASDLRSQGWKDSAGSLSAPDGTRSKLPAALVEVQAYVYAAKMGLADLYAIDGDSAHAERLRGQARELRERFERDYWMSDVGCYAQALDGDKKQVRAVTSNAGHALWCRIASPEHAATMVHRLMAPDMYTGWGIRTLSSTYPTYNPMSYHNGSVWPHDNSLIAQGFARYGFREEAAEITSALIEAGRRFPNARLPELFCGFQRDLRFSARPADYLVSCIPQAWSAGMVFLCLRTLLGMEPDLATQRLLLDPALPPWLERIDVRDLHVFDTRVTLRVRRDAKGDRIVGGQDRVARAKATASA